MSSTVASRVALLAATTLLAVPLSGCGGKSISIPTGDGGSVKVDQSGDDISIESADGTVTGGSGKMPAGYPSEEVPVVPGSIVSGVSMDTAGQKGWSVVIAPSAAGGHDAAVALLTAKGFTVQFTSDAGTSATTALQSDDWDALVGTSEVDGDITISYTVAPHSS